MDKSERISKLDEASMLLDRAASIIDEAMRMSGMERRSDELTEKIRRLSSSDSENSVVNLKREIEYSDEEHPGWTRPFASVKNVNRKDI